MLFANPLFLYALIALSVPVLIHLFNFRRYKKIYFTNVRFLSEVKQETHRRSQLRQWLLLLFRILAVASLVFAFSLPYFPSDSTHNIQTSRTYVSVYVDNSFSMEAAGPDGKLIETAKSKAIGVADAYRPSDRFLLLTNDFEGRHQRFVSRDEFNGLVEEIQVTPVTRTMSEVITRQQDMLSTTREKSREAWLISDFQTGTADLENARADSGIWFYFLPLDPVKINNVYLDTVFFDSPVQQSGQHSRLHAKIRNCGAEMIQKIPVKLILNGKQKAVTSVDLQAGEEREINLSFTNDDETIQEGYIELLDYPVVYDDRMYLTFPLVTNIPVLCIGEKENIYLGTLFSGDSIFIYTFTANNKVDYSDFSSRALIIVDGLREIPSGMKQELMRFASEGGHVFFIPPAEGTNPCQDILSALHAPQFNGTDTTPARVTYLNTESPVYADVFENPEGDPVILPENADLPSVKIHYKLKFPEEYPPEILMRLQNGDPFLTSCSYGKGRIYLLATPLNVESSNFPHHPSFILTFYKIALLSRPTGSLYHYTGRNDPVEIPRDSVMTDDVIRISKMDDSFEVIPELDRTTGSLTIYPHALIRDAGIYSVEKNKTVSRKLAFNYDRIESVLEYLPVDELTRKLSKSRVKTFAFVKEKQGPFTGEIKKMRQGTPLWKFFILTGLIFLAAEILLIRFFPSGR